MSVYRDYAKQVKLAIGSANENDLNQMLDDMVIAIGYDDMIYLLEKMVLPELDMDWEAYIIEKINFWKAK